LPTLARFLPRILKIDEVGISSNVLFYLLSSEKYQEIHILTLKGKMTRLAGIGVDYLIRIDANNHLSAVLVNPLMGEIIVLPCLRSWWDSTRMASPRTPRWWAKMMFPLPPTIHCR
jgi:hypothetical protein